MFDKSGAFNTFEKARQGPQQFGMKLSKACTVMAHNFQSSTMTTEQRAFARRSVSVLTACGFYFVSGTTGQGCTAILSMMDRLYMPIMTATQTYERKALHHIKFLNVGIWCATCKIGGAHERILLCSDAMRSAARLIDCINEHQLTLSGALILERCASLGNLPLISEDGRERVVDIETRL